MKVIECLRRGPAANYIPEGTKIVYADVQGRQEQWEIVAGWLMGGLCTHNGYLLRVWSTLPWYIVVAESTQKKVVMDCNDQLFKITRISKTREVLAGAYKLDTVKKQLQNPTKKIISGWIAPSEDTYQGEFTDKFLEFAFERIHCDISDDALLVMFQYRLAEWLESDSLLTRDFQKLQLLVDAMDVETRTLYMIDQRLKDARQYMLTSRHHREEDNVRGSDYLPSQELSRITDTYYNMKPNMLLCAEAALDACGDSLKAESIKRGPVMQSFADLEAICNGNSDTVPSILVIEAIEHWLAEYIKGISAVLDITDAEVGTMALLMEWRRNTGCIFKDEEVHHATEYAESHDRLIASAVICITHAALVKACPEMEAYKLALPDYTPHYRLSTNGALDLQTQVVRYAEDWNSQEERYTAELRMKGANALDLTSSLEWLHLADSVVAEDDIELQKLIQKQEKERDDFWRDSVLPQQEKYRAAESKRDSLYNKKRKHEQDLRTFSDRLKCVTEDRCEEENKQKAQENKYASAVRENNDAHVHYQKICQDIAGLKTEISRLESQYEENETLWPDREMKLKADIAYAKQLLENSRNHRDKQQEEADDKVRAFNDAEPLRRKEIEHLRDKIGKTESFEGVEFKTLADFEKIRRQRLGERADLERQIKDIENTRPETNPYALRLSIEKVREYEQGLTEKKRNLKKADEANKRELAQLRKSISRKSELLDKAELDEPERLRSRDETERALKETKDGSEFKSGIEKLKEREKSLKAAVRGEETEIKRLKSGIQTQVDRMKVANRPLELVDTYLPHDLQKARRTHFFKNVMTSKLDRFALSLYNTGAYNEIKSLDVHSSPEPSKHVPRLIYHEEVRYAEISVMDMDIDDWTRDGLNYPDLTLRDLDVNWCIRSEFYTFKRDSIRGSTFVPDVGGDVQWSLTTVGLSASNDGTRPNEWVSHTERLADAEAEAIGRVLAFPRQSWMEMLAFLQHQNLQLQTDLASRKRLEYAEAMVMDLVRRVGPLDLAKGDYLWARGVNTPSVWAKFKSLIDRNSSNPLNIITLWFIAEALNRLAQFGFDQALQTLHYCAEKCHSMARDSCVVSMVLSVISAYSFTSAKEPEVRFKAAGYLLSARLAQFANHRSAHTMLNNASDVLKTTWSVIRERIGAEYSEYLEEDTAVINQVLGTMWGSQIHHKWSVREGIFHCANPEYELDIMTGALLIDKAHATVLPAELRNHTAWKRLFGNLHFPEMTKQGLTYTSLPDACYPHFTIRTNREGCFTGVRVEFDNEVVWMTSNFDECPIADKVPSEVRNRNAWYDQAHKQVLFADSAGRVHLIATEEEDATGHYNMQYVDDKRITTKDGWPAQGFITDGAAPASRRSMLYARGSLKKWSDILSRIEVTEHIILTSETSGEQCKLTWTLDRWNATGLRFEQTIGDSVWRSVEYNGYQIAEEQHCPDIWGQCRSYLRLVSYSSRGTPNKPDLFLLRDFHDSSEGLAKYHEYTIHPHLGELRARTMEGNLFLAFISLQYDTGLPLSGSNGMIGAERATECLRRALAVDRLQTNSYETRVLGDIERLCSPSLRHIQQMCILIRRQVNILAGLHDETAEVGVEPSGWSAKDPALDKSIQHFGLQLPATLMGQNSTPPSGIANARAFRNVDVGSTPNTTAVSVLEGKLNDLHKGLHQYSEDEDFPEYPLSDLDSATKHMARLVDLTEESWNVHHSLKRAAFDADSLRPKVFEVQRRAQQDRDKLIEYIDSAMLKLPERDPLSVKIRRTLGTIPNFSRLDYVRAILDKSRLHLFNPYLSLESVESICDALFAWAELCVLVDRCARLLSPTATESAILTELETKRSYNVREHPSWLVFELDGQLQVRNDQQAAVFQLIAAVDANHADRDLQPMLLQMGIGSGKTRVVMPLLALYISSQAYARMDNHPYKLCRVLVPEPLLDEAYSAFVTSLSLSALAQPVLRIPFSRQVSVDADGMEDLYRHLTLLRVHGAVVMSAPSHVNSARLKLVHKGKDATWTRMPQTLLNPNLFIDIVDECDEVLRPDSELVYAVGKVKNGQADADMCVARIRILEIVLDLACAYRDEVGEKADVWDETHSAKLLDRVFTENLNLAWLDHARDYEQIKGEAEPDLSNYTTSEATQILVLRGLFSFGLLSNLLNRRYRVHYGINDTETTYKTKRLAVPFRANDTPAYKAEFARVDLVIGFTIMSYYQRGLSLEQISEARAKLSTLDRTRRDAEYSSWVKNLLEDQECPRSANDITEGNIHQLRDVLGREHAVIHFWLSMCLFPAELQIFPESISTNSWHLMNGSRRIVGFSGTRDLGILSPFATDMGHVEGHEGANGRMLTITNRVEDKHIYPVAANECAISRMIDILRRPNMVVDAIIDVGALFQGFTPSEVAERIRSANLPPSPRRRGIVYHASGVWYTLPMDRTAEAQDMASSTIPVHQCLVLYDQEHTRGVDMRLRSDAFALVTVGPGLTRDAFMQAVGRLRQLDAQQRFGLVVPEAILASIDKALSEDHTRVQRLVGWLLENTDRAVQLNAVNWVQQAVYYRKTMDPCDRRGVPQGRVGQQGRTLANTQHDSGVSEDSSDDSSAEDANPWYIKDQDVPKALYGGQCRPETPADSAIALLNKNEQHFAGDETGEKVHAKMLKIARSLQPCAAPNIGYLDQGFDTFVQRELQQQIVQEVRREVAAITYRPAVDSDVKRNMHSMAVNGRVIGPKLRCTANFKASAANSSSRHFFKYVGPLFYRESLGTYDILTQREAERYLERGEKLLHLHVHGTEDVTALLSVFNGFLSLEDERKRRYLVNCSDRMALEALRQVTNVRDLSHSIPHSHFEQALVKNHMA